MPNDAPHSLADISLRWMVRQVAAAQCGITFDAAALHRAGISDSSFAGPGLPLTPPAKARAPSDTGAPRPSADSTAKSTLTLEAYGYGRRSGESSQSAGSDRSVRTDAVDCTQEIHDQLVLDKRWWLLEIIPTNYLWQDGRGAWHCKWG